jgi:hypothetical protein
MLQFTVLDCGGFDESTTCAVKGKVPAVVGVPVIVPSVAFRVKPVGRLPERIE